MVTEEYPPYNFTENGEVVGASTEVVRAVFDKLSLVADIDVYPWKRAYHMALHQKNTLIYSIFRNEQREKSFQWVDVITPVRGCLYSLKSNKNIKITKPSDVHKYSIIANRDDIIGEQLVEMDWADKKKMRLTTSRDDNLSMLLAGRVDLIASPKQGLYHVIKKRGYQPNNIVRTVYCLEVGELYMAFSLDTSEELVEKFRQALSEFKKESRYQNIINKYLN